MSGNNCPTTQNYIQGHRKLLKINDLRVRGALRPFRLYTFMVFCLGTLFSLLSGVHWIMSHYIVLYNQ